MNKSISDRQDGVLSMDISQGMTRKSIASLFRAVRKRWYWPYILAVFFAFSFAVFAWRNYSPNYTISTSFFASKYEYDQNGNVIEVNTFTDAINRAYTYAQLVKNSQVRDAVRKAVDFDISKQEYDRAINTEVSENNAAVIISVSWYDSKGAIEISQALKAYLSHVIVRSADAGMIRWVDGYTTDIENASATRSKYSLTFFLLGLFFGIAAGLGLSLILGTFDQRVYELDNINYNCPVDVLGIVSKVEKRPAKLKRGKLLRLMSVRDESAANQRHNQLLNLAANFLTRKKQDDKRIFMFTSPTPMCGTSTVVNQVAKILSENNMKVLVITLQKDVRSAEDTMKISIVSESKKLDSCVFYLNEKANVFPTTLLGEFFGTLEKYDFVFLDCPAVLYDVELAMFVNIVDEVIIVFRYGKTTHDEVSSTASALSRAGSSILYCIWNFVDDEYTRKPF